MKKRVLSLIVSLALVFTIGMLFVGCGPIKSLFNKASDGISGLFSGGKEDDWYEYDKVYSKLEDAGYQIYTKSDIEIEDGYVIEKILLARDPESSSVLEMNYCKNSSDAEKLYEKYKSNFESYGDNMLYGQVGNCIYCGDEATISLLK